jgi:hypothetical protein
VWGECLDSERISIITCLTAVDLSTQTSGCLTMKLSILEILLDMKRKV